MSSSNSNDLLSAQSHPLFKRYDAFVEETPLVTRFILTAQFLSYLLSWVVDLQYALSNMLVFTIGKFELYRLIASPFLVNTSLIALIFAYISFSDHGKRLEISMGSTAFGWLCLMMALTSNCAFTVLAGLLYLCSGTNSYFMYYPADGIWLILFGTLAYECVLAHLSNNQRGIESRRRIFLAQVPVVYYPIALYLFFAFINATISIPYLLSLGTGYALGFGYLDRVGYKMLLSTPTARHWEETYLGSFSRRSGWISGQEILGSGAWNEAAVSTTSTAGAGMLLPLFQGTASSGSESTTDSTGDFKAVGPGSTSSGRTLGGSSQATRRAVDPRQARLQAMERNQQHQQQQPLERSGSSVTPKKDDV